MPKKYVQVILHIPLEIYETGDYKIHEDRSSMQVEPCDELPPINTSNRDSVLEVLTQMLVPNIHDKIKWNSNSSFHKDEDEEDEDEDEEEDDDDDEEEDEEEDEDEDDDEEEDEKKNIEVQEMKIYKNEIKPKKPKKENNVMTFKKHPHLKDNFTRKIRFYPETLLKIDT